MKWTYWLMLAACVALTSQQVFLNEPALIEGLLPSLPDVAAMGMAETNGQADDARLDFDEIIQMLEPFQAPALGRDPFEPDAFLPVTAIMGQDGMVVTPRPAAPRLPDQMGEDGTAVQPAGRIGTPAARSTTGGHQRPVALDSISRISRRLNTGESLFEQTRFGAASDRRTSVRRRSGIRSTRGSRR